MEDEPALGDTHGEQVVGNPLVEQVILAFVVLVGDELVVVAVLMLVENPLGDFLQEIRASWVDVLAAPEVIGLSKDGKAIETVFGSIRGVALCKAFASHVVHVLDSASLVELFVLLVAHLVQRVKQSTCLYDAEASHEAFLLVIEVLLYVAGGGDVFGGNDFLHLVDDAVDGEDVAFLDVDGAVSVDVDAVGCLLWLLDGELLVEEVAKDEFVAGEVRCIVEGVGLVSSVDDAAIDDDFADGVELVLVGEGIPRRLRDESFLDEVFEIGLDSVVGRGKDGIDTASAK